MTLRIPQATKEGYIEIEPGGGIRLVLPHIKDKKRQGAGARNGMPHYNMQPRKHICVCTRELNKHY